MINYSKLKENAIELVKLLTFTIIGLTACFYVAESKAASECVITGWVAESGGRPLRVVYTDSVYTAENCFEQSNGFVTLSSAEYALLKQIEEQQENNSSEQFNEEMYDVGFEGIIKLFIAGMGIGAILAMLSKLRR